ncbi:hypothetical protein [Bacillus suaedaesalsae]|uniref:FbpB family small basic protein n=1 Tax=Bacillus suaedaesalsae TaxID=2810349 RepID=A0ABS2DHL3_9BACI|nr:hypothetical protein [Bacillus suaedaesalsae]MBM6617979.1 hypothetical protein [Bacillus suaedaesalsae]
MKKSEHVRNSVIIVSNEERLKEQNRRDRDSFMEDKAMDAQIRGDLNKF